MAQKKVEEAKVQAQVVEEATVPEGTQESTQQPKGESPAQVVSATITEKEKKVKIHTLEEIDCLVSCVPYKFAKDKDVQVPADVAAILVNARKAYRS